MNGLQNTQRSARGFSPAFVRPGIRSSTRARKRARNCTVLPGCWGYLTVANCDCLALTSHRFTSWTRWQLISRWLKLKDWQLALVVFACARVIVGLQSCWRLISCRSNLRFASKGSSDDASFKRVHKSPERCFLRWQKFSAQFAALKKSLAAFP